MAAVEFGAKIKVVDMPEEMKEDAIRTCAEALQANGVERDTAETVKKQFDERYGAAWHCIVGRAFGSFVTHETNHFIFFTLGETTILLWKNGVASS